MKQCFSEQRQCFSFDNTTYRHNAYSSLTAISFLLHLSNLINSYFPSNLYFCFIQLILQTKYHEMAPQHAANHRSGGLYTHVGNLSIAASSFQAIPTLSSTSLFKPVPPNAPTFETPVPSKTTESGHSSPHLPFLPKPYLSFLVLIISLVLAIVVVLGSAWWLFHYPTHWSRTLAPFYVQPHRLQYQDDEEE